MTKSLKRQVVLRERLVQFRRKTIEHTFYASAVENMFVQLLDFEDPPIVLLVGPAGAGKSRALRFDLPHRLLGKLGERSEVLTPYRPYVYTELPSVDQLGFKWLDYYQRGLLLLNEPKVTGQRKVRPDELKRVMQPISEGTRARGTGVARLQLETAMIERQVRWWVMDNAAALVYTASTNSYTSQLNTVMSLANMTGAAVIVSSTYDLLALIDLNAQLDRRIIDVDIPRYDIKRRAQDYDKFCNAVLDHLEYAPISLKSDPASYLPFFYEGSLGLFGCWKVWFDRTLCEAIEHGSNAISKNHLAKWAYSKGKLAAMLAEIHDGEALYSAFQERRQEHEIARTDGAESARRTRKKGTKRLPGKRKAHHDPVDAAA